MVNTVFFFCNLWPQQGESQTQEAGELIPGERWILQVMEGIRQLQTRFYGSAKKSSSFNAENKAFNGTYDQITEMKISDFGSRIQIFSIPDPWSKFFPSRIQDPGSTSKNLSILTQKNGFEALENMIRVFHPGSGSRIWILTFY